ncbi:MAG: amidase domain-containing protein [Clostridia bacterium]|nr:amidase domain-containing protein [Clostridia bacterium]
MKATIKSLKIVLLIVIVISNIALCTYAEDIQLTSRTKSDTIISSDSCNYYIINYSSLKYMTSGTLKSGNNIYQKKFNILSGKYHIKKVRTVSGVDYYSFVPVDDTSLRLDVYNASDSEGANIQLFSYNSAYPQAQEFRLIANSDGTYYIMPRLSTTRVLASVSDGENANIELATKSGSSLQKWIIKRDKLVTTYSNSLNDSTYSPSRAGRYAIRQGANPNFTDYPDTGSNCCNFASQCIYAGGVEFKPNSPVKLITSRDDTDNWFTEKVLASEFWTSLSWSKSTEFYQHMSENFEAYRIIRYQSAWDAAVDFDYVCSNVSMGDVWQYGNMEYLEHSMVIYNRTECDGLHKGSESNECPRYGLTDLIYAQNNTATANNYINGHVYYALLEYFDRNVVFYDMTSML